MKLNLVISHIVMFSVCEIFITAFLISFLWDCKTHKTATSDERQESKRMIGVMIMLQLLGIMVITLDLFLPFLTHLMSHGGFAGMIIFAPLILLSAFLSARIITPRIFRQ